MKCPFCEWKPGKRKRKRATPPATLIYRHVKRHHLRNGLCFCGRDPGWVSSVEDVSWRDHVDANGGLEAHAQDFLMGIAVDAREEVG